MPKKKSYIFLEALNMIGY